jgi:hypothetical protein
MVYRMTTATRIVWLQTPSTILAQIHAYRWRNRPQDCIGDRSRPGRGNSAQASMTAA